MRLLPVALVLPLLLVAACKKGDPGSAGGAGPQGGEGVQGPAGTPGPAGAAGKDGAQGSQGDAGAQGPKGADGAGTVNGSRLHALYLVAGDGAQTPAGWQDAQLDAGCSFQTASDGALRCLPSGSAVQAPTLFYTDSACSQIAAAGVYPPCAASPLPSFALVPVGIGCGTGNAVWAFDEPSPAPSPGTVYANGGLGCHLATSNDLAGDSFFAVHVLDAGTFVAGSVQ